MLEVVLLIVATGMTVLSGVFVSIIVKLRNAAPEHVTKRYQVDVESPRIFTHEEIGVISRSAKADLERAINKATKELSSMLSTTTQTIDKSVKELAIGTLQKEAEAYKQGLAELREKTVKEFSVERENFAKQKLQLLSDFDVHLQQQKENELEKFYSHLNDVVSSYIADSLDQHIDLGAQLEYLTASLEANKEDIKKDILA